MLRDCCLPVKHCFIPESISHRTAHCQSNTERLSFGSYAISLITGQVMR